MNAADLKFNASSGSVSQSVS